jgi:hypothetical protein
MYALVFSPMHAIFPANLNLVITMDIIVAYCENQTKHCVGKMQEL